jgi:CRISPR/Cas system-associated protein Csm6
MEYQLQLKPFKAQDGVKYKVIQLTDIALHSTEKQPTKAVGRKIRQSFEQNKPGRLYSLKTQDLVGNGNLVKIIDDLVRQDPDFIKMVQEEERNAYKILLGLPEEGIPIKLGDDTVEFLQSKNGQRILRGLHKANN